MAGKGVRVLATPTSDLGKILACMHGNPNLYLFAYFVNDFIQFWFHLNDVYPLLQSMEIHRNYEKNIKKINFEVNYGCLGRD